MDDLRKIVKELEEEKNEDKQIALLQHIESKLLNEYKEITWGSDPVEPVEAIMQAAGLRR